MGSSPNRQNGYGELYLNHNSNHSLHALLLLHHHLDHLDHSGGGHYEHALLLCASAIVTASLASFALALVMIVVIVGARWGQAWDLELMDDMMTATMFVRLGGFAAQPVMELKFSSSTIIDNDSFSSSGVVAAIQTTLRLRSPRVLATSSLSGSSHGSPMFSTTIILWVGNHRHFFCHCDYHHPPTQRGTKRTSSSAATSSCSRSSSRSPTTMNMSAMSLG